MLIVISAVSTVIALLCLAKFKEKPPTVPPQNLAMHSTSSVTLFSKSSRKKSIDSRQSSSENALRSLGFKDCDNSQFVHQPSKGTSVRVKSNALIDESLTEDKTFSIKKQMTLAVTNIEFMLSMISSSLIICHYYAFTTLIP